MRIFRNFQEAFSEIRRDLAEMGIDVHTKTYQNKDISQDDNYATKELQFYSYRILNPMSQIDYLEAELPNAEWAKKEWLERRKGIEGYPENPGEAYKLRNDVWDDFLNELGLFDYTYGERFHLHKQVVNVIEALKKDPLSRQAHITVWHPEDSKWLGSAERRVPCSLSYLFQYRQGKLNLEYNMRSCDFAVHYKHDVFLALMLLSYVSYHTGLEMGDFIHHIASFHIYKKDIKDVY